MRGEREGNRERGVEWKRREREKYSVEKKEKKGGEREKGKKRKEGE